MDGPVPCSDADLPLLREVWHELRTPVAAIHALTGVLRSDPCPVVREEATELVAAHAEHLAALLHALGDVARGERACLDAADVGDADGAVLVRAAASAAGLRADRMLLICSGDCVVRTDRPALRQVLTNLLENARVHGVADVPVRVSLRRQSRQLVTVVSNRLPQQPAAGQGLGVGLAVTRRLVRRLGGTLLVDLPGGSRFRATVTVPVV